MKRISLAILLLLLWVGTIYAQFVKITPSGYSADLWGDYASIAGPTQARTYTFPDAATTVVGTATTQTLTNKRITKRFVSITSAASITPNIDTQDGAYMNCTEGAGTFTVNAPTGTPTPGQIWVFVLQSTNAQTFSWNAALAASTDYTRPATIGAGKAIVFTFLYEPINTTWYLVGLTNIK